MKYGRIISYCMNTPWAILDSKFDAIAMVLARCEAGERLTEEEVRDRVGERKVQGEAFVLGSEAGVAAGPSVFLKDVQASAAPGRGQKLTAVIPVWGVLVNRVASLDISETGTGVDALAADFRKAMAMPDVKTIIFDFDSPGGSVYGIDEFAQEIFDARGQGKKIIAQIDPMCASAAYYLASQCDEIVMAPSGDVGSIGVRMMHQDLSKALEMKGIKVTHIFAGKYKTEGNPTEPLSEEGLAYSQKRVGEIYDKFVGAVARGRAVKASEVKSGFGEGRVVGATEAKRIGMVDRIGTLEETLARVGANPSTTKVSMETNVEVTRRTATAENQTEVAMENANANASTVNVDVIRAGAVAEAERVEKISQLATMHGMVSKLVAWIKDGASVTAVQGEILTAIKAQPIQQPAAEQSRVTVTRDEQDKVEPGARIGRFMRSVAGAHLQQRRGNFMTPAKFATEVLKDPVTAGYFAAANPQDASSSSGGGFMLADNISNEIIEFLRPASIVRKANPTLAPLVNGVLTLPKITGGSTATWLGENKPITPSKITGGQVKAAAKKLAALVPISNDLLRYSNGRADSLVRDDMIAAMAQAEDLAFLRGSGTTYTPKGIRNWALVGNIVDSAGTTLANVRTDIGKVRLKLRGANVRFLRPVWFMSPRTEEFLLNVADANGNLVYYNEMVNNGTFRRYPYFVTTQIPENLNLLGGSNETELVLVDMADVVIADAPIIGVEVSSEASYDDGAGNMTSAFSNDQTVIRVIEETDLVVRHAESIAVMQKILWS
ncbi:MAG: peptidase [Acidobacteriales bacterium]|nr:peptidase [Terriglobales bacterium]